MPENFVNYVKFMRGSPEAFKALASKESDTLYFIHEEDALTGELYLGEVLITGGVSGDEVITSLSKLTDVNVEGAKYKDILTLAEDGVTWVATAPADIFNIPVFGGASSTQAGYSGLVKAPQIGDQNKYLKGDGTWATLAINDVNGLSSLLEQINTALQSTVKTETFEAELVKKADVSTVDTLSLTVADKADKTLVYTKTETDTAIATAVAKAPHLQRKVVANTSEIRDYADDHDDADRYVFMVSSGLSHDDNKYYEYIVIYNEDKSNYTIEKIGDWEVSLENYVTSSELETALENKVDKVFYTVPVVDENGNPVYEEDGVTPKTEQIEGALISPEDQKKLDSLVITEEGVQVSGKVNAENVQGLSEWITENRNTVAGLYPEEDAEALVQALASLTNLQSTVNQQTSDINALNTSVDSIVKNLNNYVTMVDYNNKISELESSIETLRQSVTWTAL